jgi:hypothetical protein
MAYDAIASIPGLPDQLKAAHEAEMEEVRAAFRESRTRGALRAAWAALKPLRAVATFQIEGVVSQVKDLATFATVPGILRYASKHGPYETLTNAGRVHGAIFFQIVTARISTSVAANRAPTPAYAESGIERVASRGGGSVPASGLVDAKIPWGQGIGKQGLAWEDYLASNRSSSSRLPPRFKAFDFFDEGTGLATSAKTLDTLTPARLGDPSRVYSSLVKNVDDAADFTRYRLSGTELTAEMITARELQLAVRVGTTQVQWGEIYRAIEYGRTRGVTVIVTVVR